MSHGGGAEPAPAPNSGSTAREPSRKRGNVAKTLALGIITGASVLFALGVISVGFLAIPIMTAGAAYDLGHALGWKNCSLHAKPREATKFYVAVFLATAGLVTT